MTVKVYPTDGDIPRVYEADDWQFEANGTLVIYRAPADGTADYMIAAWGAGQWRSVEEHD